MRKIIRIFMCFTLAACFVSCQKAAEMKESAELAEGRLDVTGRVADGVTKTVFTCEEHVLTPSWKVGDRIIGLWGDDKSVTWRVKSVDDEGVAKFKYVSGEEPMEQGEKVYVMYAPGKSATDVSGTGDARTLEYDLSAQPGTLEGLGEVSLMGGSGAVSGKNLELSFNHLLSIVSIDTLKGLFPGKSYSVSIDGRGLANGGTFGISGGTVTFTNGTDGKISTGGTFTSDASGNAGPMFFAFPAASLEDLTMCVASGSETFAGVLPTREIVAGNYYYSSAKVAEGGIKFGFTGDKKIQRFSYKFKNNLTGDVIDGVRDYDDGVIGSAADLTVAVPAGEYVDFELEVETEETADWGGLYFKRPGVAVNVGGTVTSFPNVMKTEEWQGVLMWYPEAGEESLYWSKYNVGATNGSTKETWYGDYYTWGAVEKIYSSVDYSKMDTNQPAFEFLPSPPEADIMPDGVNKKYEPEYWTGYDVDPQFYSWVHTAYCLGAGPHAILVRGTKYEAPGDTLEYVDDVAWNKAAPVHAWHMPDRSDFEKLLQICGNPSSFPASHVEVYYNGESYRPTYPGAATVDGLYGVAIVSAGTGGTDRKLFFPSAELAGGATISSLSGKGGSTVGCWSRTLREVLDPWLFFVDYDRDVNKICVYSYEGSAPEFDCRVGMSVRPVRNLD